MVQIMVGMLTPHETIARNVGDGIWSDASQTTCETAGSSSSSRSSSRWSARRSEAASVPSPGCSNWLDGPEVAPRLRLGDDADAPPIQVNGESRVVIYLSDNGRGDGKPSA
jgi:hypothetical protein